jgi:GT2 family glycosyltransferase
MPGSITVVIPTLDRYDKLKALLKSIRRHRTRELDSVIVVDDSVPSVDLVREFEDLDLKQILSTERRFITKSKNVGWKSSKTEFVYFIDDDNVMDEKTITPVYGAISESNRNAAVSPAVLYKSRPDLVWVYATPFLNSSLRHNLVGRNLPRNPSLENRILRTDALPNASLVRRRALEDVGGFDERLVVNSSMDLSIRLKARGWHVFANTAAFIYHDVEPPGRFGWWATHGSVDPGRIRYEIRDWFLIMRMLHGKEPLFTSRAMLESSRFVLPNLLSYLVRSESRKEIVRNLLQGYVEGLVWGVGLQHNLLC